MVKISGRFSQSGARQARRRGGALVELVFFLPWIIFLFVGALDSGFYLYALISVESAARVAASYTSTSTGTADDSAGACTYALNELQSLPQVGTSVTSCSANPVTVTASKVTGPDGGTATLVSVTYQSTPLIPIPGLLASQFTWTRSVKMRVLVGMGGLG